MTNAGRYFVLFAVAAGFGCGSRTRNSGDPVPPRAVEHVVVFWLKEPGNPDAVRRVIDASHGFQSLPGVIRVDAGTVLPSPRANVDNTFDVAVIMVFESADALEAYQVHPRHRAMLAEVGPLVERTVAYDFVRRPASK